MAIWGGGLESRTTNQGGGGGVKHVSPEALWDEGASRKKIGARKGPNTVCISWGIGKDQGGGPWPDSFPVVLGIRPLAKAWVQRKPVSFQGAEY